MSNDNETTPKRRGRPRKIKPLPDTPPSERNWTDGSCGEHETPTIKEGAHWQVGVPEEEQDELKRRHNEAMQNKQNEPPQALDIVTFEEAQRYELTSDSAIQIKEGPNRGVICQVGQVEGDLVMCYQQLLNGEKTYLSTKMGEFIVLCPRRSGMVARRWEQKETAPQWHENKVHVPEGN